MGCMQLEEGFFFIFGQIFTMFDDFIVPNVRPKFEKQLKKFKNEETLYSNRDPGLTHSSH